MPERVKKCILMFEVVANMDMIEEWMLRSGTFESWSTVVNDTFTSTP